MLDTVFLTEKQFEKVQKIMKRSKGRKLFTRKELEEVNQKLRGSGEANSPSFITHNEAGKVAYNPEKGIERGTYDLSVFKLAKTPAQEAARKAAYAHASGRKAAPKRKAKAAPKAKAVKRTQVRKGVTKKAPVTAPTASEAV